MAEWLEIRGNLRAPGAVDEMLAALFRRRAVAALVGASYAPTPYARRRGLRLWGRALARAHMHDARAVARAPLATDVPF